MESDRSLLVTTQPGWTFATLAELRSRGERSYMPSFHRDSSLVIGGDSPGSKDLLTPASVFGSLLLTEATATDDSTTVLRRRLSPVSLKEQVLQWLPRMQNANPRRYAIATEVYGQTSLRRREISDLLETTLGSAFPRWKRTGAQGARFVCKADPRVAVLGVQLYSNLGGGDDQRPGSLRAHLAAGLLTMAGVGPGDAVFDPFMGTGTILKMAREGFMAGSCVGLEVDSEAYGIAAQRLDDGVSSLNVSFEDFDAHSLPKGVKLVSNLPFGRRFAQVPSRQLTRLIESGPLDGARAALLMSRQQAKEIAPARGFRRKNVLVLGQPATILYSVDSD